MNRYAMIGDWCKTPTLEQFALGIRKQMDRNGYQLNSENPDVQIVFNFVDVQAPKHFRRKGKGTFVVTIAENDRLTDIFRTHYPILIRSLGNLMICLDHSTGKQIAYFLTLEQGCYPIPENGDIDHFFQRIFERIRPLATSQLIIDNDFESDLSEDLWKGDPITEKINHAGKLLDKMNLLPTPFPIEKILPPREFRHIKRLYGIGGLSYGNLSARKDKARFWMSASGVDKANLKDIGRDVLLIKGYDQQKQSMQISVPKHIEPRRASVDAIEHWMIYREHPKVGAIVHIHAWMDGIPSTEINYPCGTLQLAEAVADHIRQADNPTRAVVGLKNHGLTITGPDIDDIFERIEGRIIPQVPMS